MIEIELPCCGTATQIDELAEVAGCERCGVVLDLDPVTVEALPIAA